MPTWPSGNRDTTEFPTVDIAIAPNLRTHLDAFTKLDGVNWTGYDDQRSESGLTVEDSRLRTYRKMYEQLGLIYQKNGSIALSTLGHRIASIGKSLVDKKTELLEEAARDAVEILSRYQFKNPVDDRSDELPADYDVFPFWAIWKAMSELDGKLHHEELNRVLMRVEHMTDLSGAIEKISLARSAIGDYKSADESTLTHHLGERVETNQPSARMASWFSIAGWGGLIIDLADNDGYRLLTAHAKINISDVLQSSPVFFVAHDRESWFDHYIGKQAVVVSATSSVGSLVNIDDIVDIFYSDISKSKLLFEKVLLCRFLTSLLAKKFLILTGLAGSGKTKLAEVFAMWLCESPEQCRIAAVGADWTSNENLLGYADALQAGQYRAPVNGALELIIRASTDIDRPYFLILDEMNLSHVERYFADFLSAMESDNAPLSLHGAASALALGKQGASLVPAKLALPANLFIIGTVNVDETTYMFSPKVLDRANVIEFRATANQMDAFLGSPTGVNLKVLEAQGKAFATAFVQRSQADADIATLTDPAGNPLTQKFKNDLLGVFETLALIGAEFGFRTAKEIARFMVIHKELSGPSWAYKDALDAQVLQKLMPKLHGSERKLSGVLKALEEFAKAQDLPLTLEKVDRMQKRLLRDGFTSFAEA
jgi:hypothetical protein